MDSENKEANEQLLAFVDRIMKQLTTPYVPSSDGDSVEFSTIELQNAILEHTGQEVPLVVICNWLIEHEYHCVNLGNLQLRWLMGREDARPFRSADKYPVLGNENN